MMTNMTTNIMKNMTIIVMKIMMMEDLRKVVKSTRVVKVAVGGNDNNVFSNKLCVSEVAKQAIVKV